MVDFQLETRSAQETERLGALCASALVPGDVVSVEGELGAGKSTFVRGACRGLGIEEPVTSPTFVLGRRYEASGKTVAHVDLYRLDRVDLEDPSLLDDYAGEGIISFVEWPDRGADVLGFRPPSASIRISHAGDDRRTLEIAADQRIAEVLRVG